MYIYSDLLAAAHACLAKKSGLVGILGTGANTAYYDGEVLHQKVPSLGYVLGDEGRLYLGKLLLSSLLRGNLHEKLSKKLCLKKEEVLEKIHSSAQPNKYLASFGPFLFRNRMDPQISILLKQAFGTFVDNYVSPYGDAQHISMVGSIAYYFRTELQYVLNERGHYLGTVIEHPISAFFKLVLFRRLIFLNLRVCCHVLSLSSCWRLYFHGPNVVFHYKHKEMYFQEQINWFAMVLKHRFIYRTYGFWTVHLCSTRC